MVKREREKIYDIEELSDVSSEEETEAEQLKERVPNENEIKIK